MGHEKEFHQGGTSFLIGELPSHREFYLVSRKANCEKAESFSILGSPVELAAARRSLGFARDDKRVASQTFHKSL